MLDLFAPTVIVHCSHDQLTLQRRTCFGRDSGTPVVRTLAEQGPPFDHLLQQLRHALTELACNGAVLDVLVPDAWCRLFVTTPPSNIANRSDCAAAVAMRFQSLYGESAADWVMRADWQVATPFVTAAMPQTLHCGLLAVVHIFKLRVARMAPECVAAWNRWRREVNPGDWFGQADDTQLTLMALDGERVRHIVQQRLDQSAWQDPDWLRRHVQREALRLNLSVPERVACAGRVPSAWMTANADTPGARCHALAEKKRPALAPHREAVPARSVGSAL